MARVLMVCGETVFFYNQFIYEQLVLMKTARVQKTK